MIALRRWYALYTKPKWEKRVSELLSRKRIENYCPLNKVVRQGHDRKKVLLEPLFTSYVFVRLNDHELWTSKTVDGVLSIVHWLNKPAVIRNEEIETIQSFLNKHENIRLEKTTVSFDENVRVICEPLMLLEGSVLEARHKLVKVFLPSLGYHMVAEIKTSKVESVAALAGNLITLNYHLVS